MASIHRVTWKTKKGEDRVAFRVSYWLEGKKKFRQFPTKRKAHAFTETLHIHKGKESARLRDSRLPTVAEAAALWIADCRGRLRPDTVKWYEGIVNNHLMEVCSGQDRLSSGVFKSISDAGVRNGGPQRALRAFQSFCVSTFGISFEPIRRNRRTADVKKRVGGVVRLGVPSPAEIGLLLLAADRLAERKPAWKKWRALLYTLVFTGMRISELRALTWGAFDVVEKRIEVNQSADKSGIIHPPKTASGYRCIDVPDQLSVILEDTRASVEHTSENDLIFGTRNNTALQMKTLRKWFQAPLEAEAGVRFRLHGLRHHYASRLIQSGFNVLEVSRLMGHSDPAFTIKVYGHLFDDRDSRADRRRRMNLLADGLLSPP